MTIVKKGASIVKQKMPIVKKECQKGDENINVNCQKAIVR